MVRVCGRQVHDERQKKAEEEEEDQKDCSIDSYQLTLTACLATHGHALPQPGLSSPASTIGNGRARLLQAALDAARGLWCRQRRHPIGRTSAGMRRPTARIGVGHPMVASFLFLQGTTRDARHRNRGWRPITNSV